MADVSDQDGVMLSRGTADRMAAATRYVETTLGNDRNLSGNKYPKNSERQVGSVKLSSTATATGEYVGRVYFGPETRADGSTDLAAANLWKDPGADNCLVLNPPEIPNASGTHALPTGDDQIYSAFISHLSDEGTPRLVMVLIGVATPAVFPVTVEKTGGSDGSQTTTASWTYTVKSLAGTSLGTSVALTRPRPNGLMTFQSGSSGYGLAFYDGTTLKLWDAGEVETTGNCT